jgi:hypothetical protein
VTRAALRGFGDIRVVAAGLLLLQLVWIFAVPPFRGSDEFDHAYRAAAVARGEWAASPEAATRGTGAWLHVPDDVVDAAQPQCSDLKYTGPEDCVGSRVDADTVRVASGAGRYHPFFYALVGAPALPFDGTASLYVMRAMGALLTCGFFLLALVATRCWARTRWPYVALAVAMTPVAVYGSVLPAPNGLEMTSAMALWAALLGLSVCTDARRDTRLLTIGAVSAAVLVTLRSFGPLWCVLILLTVLLAVRVSRFRLREIVVTSKGWVAMLFVLLATLGSLAWIRVMGSLVVGVAEEAEPLSAMSKAATTARQTVLWVLQSIAAFPLRNEQTHAAVYVLLLLVAGTLVVAALRASSGRGRAGLVVAAALSLLVPAAVTFTTLETYGAAWQGRYTLPYSIGVVLLAGALLERRSPHARTDVLLAGAVCFVIAQALSPFLVAVRERVHSPGVENGAWVLVPPVVLGVLAVVGASLMWLGAALMHDDVEDAAEEEVPHDRSDRPGVAVGADR